MADLIIPGFRAGQEFKSEEYLQALLRFGGLSQAEEERVQNELWLLMERQVRKFTLGDSSSVPLETAEKLLKSIFFTLGLYLKNQGGFEANAQLVKQTSLALLFQAGQKHLAQIKEEVFALNTQVRQTAVALGNISYEDTLAELDQFFTAYDIASLAHEIPCMLDYQLCLPCPDGPGIEYIRDYLSRLLMENQFLGHFDKAKISALLENYTQSYEEDLINMCEPVFINAVGLEILGQDIFELEIRGENQRRLAAILADSGPELKKAVDGVCLKLGISEAKAKAYFRLAGQNLQSRVEALGDKSAKIFISFKQSQEDGGFKYQSGRPMDNEDLQALIEELRDCRILEQKLELVKKRIHSLDDLIEIMKICFWQEEFFSLFESLDQVELLALLQIAQKNQYSPAETIPGWEHYLRNYLKADRKGV